MSQFKSHVLVYKTWKNQKRIELERRKQEIEREKDELKQFYSEAFECSTHSVNHDPNFLQLLDDVVVSIIWPKNQNMFLRQKWR